VKYSSMNLHERKKGWDRLPGYQPSDVWVDAWI
jgi:hypothetical protein